MENIVWTVLRRVYRDGNEKKINENTFEYKNILRNDNVKQYNFCYTLILSRNSPELINFFENTYLISYIIRERE